MLLRVASLDETTRVASALAALARVGDVIVLAGEMGAGKTAFAQGFGKAVGVVDPITSPTFTIVHSYPTASSGVTLHHADLYRLNSTGDIDDLALPELAEFGGIVLVEWGDVASDSLGDHLVVTITHDDDDLDLDDLGDPDAASGRLIELDQVGHAWDSRWDRLAASVAGWR